ncbi:MAG TPA: DEAD/DEAH box helicase [Deltaproteobacteria bacterium]|nr:DEAD/DEAH box helicase [Deltaproteobacteria bacterium]
MTIFPQMNNSGRKRDRTRQHGRQSSMRASGGPYTHKIHRSLSPVLDRIRTPEPVPFVPDPFQLKALSAIEASDVLVTAPTGAGKTYIAVEAIDKVFHRGGKSWYASPLKALSNAKYQEFREIFGRENVGILTGDRKENPLAPVIVGTTEILRNQLYDTMHRGEDIDMDLVVLDEAHYLGDVDRGVVWEEVLIYLPPRVRLLLLSATILNGDEICKWLTWMRGSQCEWVAAYERPVPLFPLFLFPGGELAPLATRRGLLPGIEKIDPRSLPRTELPEIPRILDALRNANLLPAIFFLKSRADCDRAVEFCRPAQGPSRQESPQFREELAELLDEYPFLRTHQHLSTLKSCRVGSHHGGQLPHWKLFLEKMMQSGHLDAIFSTSTIAAGVNFPARTVVIFQSDRFNGKEFATLSATELLQMTGRAGRRGMDEIGFVLIIPGPHQDPRLINELLKSSPDPIQSQIRVNFSMVLNLLLSHSPEEIRDLFVVSLSTFQNLSRDTRSMKKLEAVRAELEQYREQMGCGSLDELFEIRPKYSIGIMQLRKMRRSLKRRPGYRKIVDQLAPGRVFISQRGTPYICVAWPDFEYGNVEAIRLAHPIRMRRRRIRTHRVAFQRLRELSVLFDSFPDLEEREEWENLIARAVEGEFRPVEPEGPAGPPPADLPSRDLAATAQRLHSYPCEKCSLFDPCQKETAHPFSAALRRHFHLFAKVDSTQEQLWRSFIKYYRLLQAEGYVEEDGNLTRDGMWASKLRLDQPLLISEGIRKNVFPRNKPDLLAALIAPFVTDRDKQGDVQLASFIWKYPDLAKPFFQMLKDLQRLRERLQAEGFETPPLPFWTVVTVYHWAQGLSWEQVREISGMDEGDLAMIILRTADHLRQIEALSQTHPKLAATAAEAIGLLLREPVLAD